MADGPKTPGEAAYMAFWGSLPLAHEWSAPSTAYAHDRWEAAAAAAMAHHESATRAQLDAAEARAAKLAEALCWYAENAEVRFHPIHVDLRDRAIAALAEYEKGGG